MSKITTNRLDVAAMLTTKACCYLDATMEIVEISGVSQKIGQNWRIDKAIRELIHHDWFGDGTFLKVRSVAYVADNESDKSAMKAYMMINRGKDTTLYNSIREYAETSGKLRTRLTTAYEILSSERNAHAIIIRLFFGYMVNDIKMGVSPELDKLVYSNTLGKIIYPLNSRGSRGYWITPPFMGCKKQICMVLRLSDDGVLTASAQTFSNILHARILEDENCRYLKPYIINRVGRFVPVDSPDPNKEYWYEKGEKKHRAEIPFINYDRFDSYKSSRCGALASFFEIVDKKLSEYVVIKPWEYESTDFTTIRRKFDEGKVFHECCERLRHKGITIVDVDGDDRFLERAESLKSILAKAFCINVRIGDIEDNGFNILLHHDEEFYSIKNNGKATVDVRKQFSAMHPNAIAQGITHERYSDVSDEPASLLSMLKVCIISLCIKEDFLQHNRCTLTDFNDLGLDKGLTIATRRVEWEQTMVSGQMKKSKHYRYYIAIFASNGDLQLRNMRAEEACISEDAEIRRIDDAFRNRHDGTQCSAVEWIAFTDSEDIYRCSITDERVLPNIRNIYHALLSVSKRLPIDDFFRMFGDFEDFVREHAEDKSLPSMEDISEYRILLYNNLSDSCSDALPLSKFQKALDSRHHKRLYNAFTKYLWVEKGLKLSAGIRQKKENDQFAILSLYDIHYCQTPQYSSPHDSHETLQDTVTFYVGKNSTTAFNKTGPSRGFPMRQLNRVNGEKIDTAFVERLLGLCTADFVRLHEFTVSPFLMKYINEFIELERFRKKD